MRLRRACSNFLLLSAVSALDINTQDVQSIKNAAGTAAYNAMTFYNANQTGGVPGNLPAPYYWWEAGALMMTMIEYWYLTGDETYNQQVQDAMIAQSGDLGPFLVAAQASSEGNDDQGFWALAALDAAEFKFPDPPPNKPQWLALAQGVFNEYVTRRWETTDCGGGMRWQKQASNKGWDYKNSVSNGCLFSIAARLARYQGDNQTFDDWANKAWDWEWDLGYIDHNDYSVYDGGHIDKNCTDIDRTTWSYNSGLFLYGAANMYNLTQDQKWLDRTNRLLDGMIKNNFNNKVLIEPCEPDNKCNNDQVTFKAYTMRWLAATTQLVSSTAPKVQPLLAASAQGAAKACSGPSQSNPAGHSIEGSTCGLSWVSGKFDGSNSPGEEMAAMSVFQNNIIFVNNGAAAPKAPATGNTGGTSKGDPNAGLKQGEQTKPLPPITTADKAGAGILTFLLCAATVALPVWIIWE